jgi:hypothetical protein
MSCECMSCRIVTPSGDGHSLQANIVNCNHASDFSRTFSKAKCKPSLGRTCVIFGRDLCLIFKCIGIGEIRSDHHGLIAILIEYLADASYGAGPLRMKDWASSRHGS